MRILQICIYGPESDQINCDTLEDHFQNWAGIDWVAVGVVVNALIAGFVYWIGRGIRRNARRQNALQDARIARENELEEARAARERRTRRRRDRLQAFDGYRKELVRFSDEVIDVMGEIQTLIAFNPDRADVPANARQRFVEERSRLIGRVSSLVDRGRFFFPVEGSAQKGLRDPALNRLLAARHVLMAIDYEKADHNKPWIRWKTLAAVQPGTEANVCLAFRHLSREEQGRLLRELKHRTDLRLMDLVVSAKRAFVSEVLGIVQPTEWLGEVEGAYGIELRSRKPEAPGVDVPQPR